MSTSSEKSQAKKRAVLIEELGQVLEGKLNLSPLTARIYTLLVLSTYDGLSFDEVRESMQASKSSISVSLNLLIKLDYIKSYTKPGGRKRFFKLDKYSQLRILETYFDEIDKEKSIVEKINAFNQIYYPEKFIQEESLGIIFENYLVEKEKLLSRTIATMKEFQKKEPLE